MTQPNDLTPVQVNQLHKQSDRDSSREAQHHTLGVNPYQSSPGNHSHDGRDSKVLSGVSVGAHSHNASEINSTAVGALTSTQVQAALEELQGDITGIKTATTVTGSRGGNAALASLLSALAAKGIITDSTTV